MSLGPQRPRRIDRRSGGRRFIVPQSERFAMVASASATNEFVMGEQLDVPPGASSDAATQAFWAIRYDPAAEIPFGAPTRLFRARLADFPGRNYAVDRNAQHFVFKQHVTVPSPREIRLIDHWHAASRGAMRGAT